MIDVRRANCKTLYFHYLVFRVLHFKKIVSNVSILGDVSIIKSVSSASDYVMLRLNAKNIYYYYYYYCCCCCCCYYCYYHYCCLCEPDNLFPVCLLREWPKAP